MSSYRILVLATVSAASVKAAERIVARNARSGEGLVWNLLASEEVRA